MKENESINKNFSREKNSNDENQKEIVKTSFFHKAIPIMPKYLAIICCILNIVIPGLGNIQNNEKILNCSKNKGTLISSFSIFCCAKHKCETNLKAFLINFFAFILQLCSAVILIGWVWSIKYGILFVHLSSRKNIFKFFFLIFL